MVWVWVGLRIRVRSRSRWEGCDDREGRRRGGSGPALGTGTRRGRRRRSLCGAAHRVGRTMVGPKGQVAARFGGLNRRLGAPPRSEDQSCTARRAFRGPRGLRPRLESSGLEGGCDSNVGICVGCRASPNTVGSSGRETCELCARGSRREHTLHVGVAAMSEMAVKVQRPLGARDRVLISGRLRSERVADSNRCEYRSLPVSSKGRGRGHRDEREWGDTR